MMMGMQLSCRVKGYGMLRLFIYNFWLRVMSLTGLEAGVSSRIFFVVCFAWICWAFIASCTHQHFLWHHWHCVWLFTHLWPFVFPQVTSNLSSPSNAITVSSLFQVFPKTDDIRATVTCFNVVLLFLFMIIWTSVWRFHRRVWSSIYSALVQRLSANLSHGHLGLWMSSGRRRRGIETPQTARVLCCCVCNVFSSPL